MNYKTFHECLPKFSHWNKDHVDLDTCNLIKHVTV